MSNLKLQAGAWFNTSGSDAVEFNNIGHTIALPRRQKFSKKEPGADGYGRYLIRTSYGVAQADGTVRYILIETSIRVCRGATSTDCTNALTSHLVPITNGTRAQVASDMGVTMTLPNAADVL